MVGAQAIIGDIVSPRDRGRYVASSAPSSGSPASSGRCSAGSSSITSPGVDLYINLPIGAVALVVIASQVPGHLGRVHHVIDYLGAAVLAAAAASLVLFTSLGGTTYAWGSTTIITLAVLGVALLGLFVVVERRATEPVLPLHLFRMRTFWVTSVVGFIVGFAMFGAIVYLPAFFQVVRGISPTLSGVQLLPLMAGLLVVSIGSGQIISKTGKYRFWPIAGSAVMTIGVLLLSRMEVHTSAALEALYMVLLGMGLGGVMQVLVIIVQNAVPHSDLGVATSAATFFRSIGGSFGTAIFGAIFSNVVVSDVRKHLHGTAIPRGFDLANVTPKVLGQLPKAVHTGIVYGYAEAIGTVFAIAVPIAALAFVFTWLIPNIELRKWSAGGPPVAEEGPISAGQPSSPAGQPVATAGHLTASPGQLPATT